MIIDPNDIPNTRDSLRVLGTSLDYAAASEDVVGDLSRFVDSQRHADIIPVIRAFVGIFPRYHFQRIVLDRINSCLANRTSARGAWRTRAYMRQPPERAADPIAVLEEVSKTDSEFYSLYVRYRKGVSAVVRDSLWWRRDFGSIKTRLAVLTSYVWAVKGVVMQFEGTFNPDGSPQEIFLVVGDKRTTIYLSVLDAYTSKEEQK